MQIPVEPNLDVPPPTGAYPENGETYEERVRIAGNTALLLSELGMDDDISEEEAEQAAKMMAALKPAEHKNTKPTKQDSLAYEAGYNIGKRGGKGGPNERPVVRMGRYEGQNSNKPAVKSKPKTKPVSNVKKRQAGGTVKTIKRVGPIDPNGAYTKVQERTIAGKKAPKVPLKKDKQLGATKMKSGGKVSKKK